MPFGLAEAVERGNLTWELQLSQANEDNEVISWCLEALGGYSASSMYLRLSQGGDNHTF
jgi:hypothetical protein